MPREPPGSLRFGTKLRLQIPRDVPRMQSEYIPSSFHVLDYNLYHPTSMFGVYPVTVALLHPSCSIE